MEVLAGEFEEVKRSVLLQMKKKKKKEMGRKLPVKEIRENSKKGVVGSGVR